MQRNWVQSFFNKNELYLTQKYVPEHSYRISELEPVAKDVLIFLILLFRLIDERIKQHGACVRTARRSIYITVYMNRDYEDFHVHPKFRVEVYTIERASQRMERFCDYCVRKC